MSKVLVESLMFFFRESSIPLTLSDPRQPDDPLIYANAPFYQLTGYSPDQALGRNCRFLQGRETGPAARKLIQEDYAARRDSRVILRNYRLNGEPFDNFLFLFTVRDQSGSALYRIGSQFEIPAVNKLKRLEEHADELAVAVQKLQLQASAAREQVISLADVVGVTVKDLLMARLSVLKS